LTVISAMRLVSLSRKRRSFSYFETASGSYCELRPVFHFQ